jgi:hypothetical protein
MKFFWISIIFISKDELSKNNSPVSEMAVSYHSIPEFSIEIDKNLSLIGSTHMTNMKRFSDIGSYIVYKDILSIVLRSISKKKKLLILKKSLELRSIKTIGKKEIQIGSSCLDSFKKVRKS